MNEQGMFKAITSTHVHKNLNTYVRPRSCRYWPTSRITSTSLFAIFGGLPEELCPLVDAPLRAEVAPSPWAAFFELPFVACCILTSLNFFRGGGEKPPSLDSPLEARMATSARDYFWPWIQPWKSPTLHHLHKDLNTPRFPSWCLVTSLVKHTNTKQFDSQATLVLSSLWPLSSIFPLLFPLFPLSVSCALFWRWCQFWLF